jgi:FlaA1/EpsC-like NDP-sugar epimerase
MVSIFKAVTLACIISYTLMVLVTGKTVPLSIVLRNYETSLLFLGGVRFLWRIWRDNYITGRKQEKRALIIGAGDAGTMLAKDLKSRSSNLYPAAFIDDNVHLHNRQTLGIPVIGGREAIPEAVEKYKIDEILIAIPSLSKAELSKIIDICKNTNARIKIIPNLNDILSGKIQISEMRDVQVEDLLGRDPVQTDLRSIAEYLENKVVLVTGAGGSIGSELSRQIAEFRPDKLLLLGHGENSIYSIERELTEKYPDLTIEPLIADIQDRVRIETIFEMYRPHVVFHAAAHKHVPLMEKNPTEAVKNNVFGTKNVADCADQYKAERFVLISTDKAVNPSSVMGTTKRIAEMYIQSINERSATKFAAVRFGNVLGSRGSVIPLFKEQIARGGPVTVTHPDMMRYFMTIPEAVQLVIQAGALSEGGEIFILDMGKPVRILDLAVDLIKLSGYEPYTEIPIKFTGIRDGEKLFEELHFTDEQVTATKHDRIFIGKLSPVNGKRLAKEFQQLESILYSEQEAVATVLEEIVPSVYRTSVKEKDKVMMRSLG